MSLVYLKVDGSGVRPVKLRFVIFGRLTLIGKFFSTNSGYDSDGFVEFFSIQKIWLKNYSLKILALQIMIPVTWKVF